MGRKGMDKVVWIVLSVLLAFVVVYLAIKITGGSFFGFESLVHSGLEESNQTINESIENITKGW